MSLVERLVSTIETVSEADLHPHSTQERAELFHAFDPGSAEVEIVNFLNALVFLVKPMLVLETGTGKGFTTIGIADALRMNGQGHLHTVELDPSTVEVAKTNLEQFDPALASYVTFHCQSSLDLIDAWPGPAFDFALFDSLIAFRHIEFERLMERGMLAKGAVCCFHDTSRLRGKTMHDYNPEMIAALDRHSEGRQWLESELSRGFGGTSTGGLAKALRPQRTQRLMGFTQASC